MSQAIRKLSLVLILTLVIGNIYLIYWNQNLKKELKKEVLISRSNLSLEYKNSNYKNYSLLKGITVAPEKIKMGFESIYISKESIAFEVIGNSLEDIEDIESFLNDVLEKTKLSMTLLSEGENIKGTLIYGGF